MSTINPTLDSGPRAATSVAEGAERTALPACESAVSWGAIIAGGVGAAALSLILLLLGTGLGLSSVSPWAGHGASAMAFGLWTIAWLTFTQLAASAMGGYLAGRLRTRWTLAHTDEVYFRDTAHGFLAWALATLVTAGLLTSTIGAMVDQGVEAGTDVVAGVATTAVAAGVGAVGDAADDPLSGQSAPAGIGLGYFVDSLFRKDATLTTAPAMGAADSRDLTSGEATAEVLRIFANDLRSGLSDDDTRYVTQLVQEHTGLSQPEAQRRVTQSFATMQSKINDAEVAAREAAEKARKASATASLWMFVSLLIGAFVASLAAPFGGRRRDLADQDQAFNTGDPS